MLSHRVGGLAGIGFLVLVMAANVILGSTGQPGAGASPQEVREFFADSGDAVAAASSIATLAWLCLVVFAAGVTSRLRQGAPEKVESWPLIGLGGAILQNAMFAIVIATQVALSTGELSDDSAGALWQVHNAIFTLNGTSLALILLGFSVAGLRAGLIRVWHGRLGLVAAAVLATSSFLTPFQAEGGPAMLAGLLGFVLWLVWVATYSVTLLRRGRTAPTAPQPSPVTAPA